MQNLKETKYFISGLRYYNELQMAVEDVESKKQKFLKENTNAIAEIVTEQIKFVTLDSGQRVYAIIELSFFINND